MALMSGSNSSSESLLKSPNEPVLSQIHLHELTERTHFDARTVNRKKTERTHFRTKFSEKKCRLESPQIDGI
jgi:hypothetical protein